MVMERSALTVGTPGILKKALHVYIPESSSG